MKSAQGKYILAFVFVAQIFISCSGSPAGSSNSQGNSNQSTLKQGSANDKAEELSMLINLPVEPAETVWREDSAGKSGDNAQFSKKITAVMQFSAEDAGRLSALVEKNSPPLTTSIGTETWFPAELIAQSDLSGDDTLKGDSFAATDFFQPPYSDGRITRIEGTNYFVLELFAK